ncbi:MAG: dihydroorotase [Candidatus Tectimicrobiota bacterium]|nr:MAG: dihydroorotase [Candidatus Tectomicrobia bacterium]
MHILIRGGRVIDPAQGLDRHLDVWIADGKIAALDKNLPLPPAETLRVIDARGCVVAPGFIDMHTHLREPGFEHKETIATGLAAAAAGGFTAVAAMANTQPVNDTAAVTEYMLQRAAAVGGTRLYPIGAVSQGLRGKELAEIGSMHRAGIVALSDDGMPVMNSRLLRRAMEYGAMLGLPVISHCEDQTLAAGGVMHEGVVSTELGLPGIPAAAESIMVYRDVQLAALTGAHVHIAHLSTAEAVDLVRRAKDKGLPVTAEACPHHFTLTDEAVRGYDTNTKVNPPLRPAADVEAVKAGLQDGTIEVIASDHAPHHAAEKEQDYLTAPFGMIGLETTVSLALQLYHEGLLSLPQLVTKFTVAPARILGLPHGTLRVGSTADVTILDPEYELVVEAATLRSRSKNSPFLGWRLRGAAVMTIVGGHIVFERL